MQKMPGVCFRNTPEHFARRPSYFFFISSKWKSFRSFVSAASMHADSIAIVAPTNGIVCIKQMALANAELISTIAVVLRYTCVPSLHGSLSPITKFIAMIADSAIHPAFNRLMTPSSVFVLKNAVHGILKASISKVYKNRQNTRALTARQMTNMMFFAAKICRANPKAFLPNHFKAFATFFKKFFIFSCPPRHCLRLYWQ